MDYWACAMTESPEHKLFVCVKVIYANNEEMSYFKYIESTMTLKSLKREREGERERQRERERKRKRKREREKERERQRW